MAGGLNLYGYANGDPVNLSDPFGLFACCDASDVAAVFGSVAAKTAPLNDAAEAAAEVAMEVSGPADAIEAGESAAKGHYGSAAFSVAMSLLGKPAKAVKGGIKVVRIARESSAKIRRNWEAATGKVWPKDPKTGRNQDVSHKQPLADGGDNSVENVEPLPHEEHVRQHQEWGDFVRWGGRRQP